MQCLDDETAALVLVRGLGSEALAAIEEHVDGCEDCLHLLASLAETMTPPPDPPSDTGGGSTRMPLYQRGARIGRYVLVEKVGAGGMGSVFAAEDPALARTIAIKLVRTTLRSDRANENLLAEARMMAQLSHPNVVPVYDVGAEAEHVFLAMELIDGGNLRQWLAEEKRTVPAIVRVFLEAGRGLVAAHRAGLVHRDFKPDNVLVGKDGRVVVTDFGLAHSTLAPSDRVAGTMAYMAPEQRDGKVADARSDQFSFAVALYEALTGERPRIGAASTASPAWLGRIAARGMATDPEARFPSMQAMLDALAHDPKRAWRRRIGALVAIGAVVAIGGAMWSARRTHACAEAVPAKLA
ncbi:MAG TPA: serine/threonine-protein kinase, partial [Labilithrix sp.]